MRMDRGIRSCTIALCCLLAHAAAAQEPLLPELRRAAKAEPSSMEAQLALGRALIRAGRSAEAAAQMERAVRLDRRSLDALYAAAEVQFSAGESRKARSACQRLAKLDPDDVRTLVCTARAFLAWRRSSQAFAPIEKALVVAPDDPRVLLVVADARRIAGQLDEALAAYRRAIGAAPGQARAHLGSAQVLELDKQPDAALKAFRKALELDPDDPELQLELGRRLDGDEAVRLLERANAGRLNWPTAELELAAALRRAGDPAAAATRLQAMLKKDPGNAPARAQHGMALLELGRAAEAEAELRKATLAMPNDYDASFALARVYERTGRPDDAVAQYRHTADLKRESVEPLVAAARLGLAQQRPLLASGLLDLALQRAPRSAELLSLYGDSLVAREDPSGARDYYERALKGEGAADREAIRRKLHQLGPNSAPRGE
jgi:tetratricopeptide (TPR) repeat protein